MAKTKPKNKSAAKKEKSTLNRVNPGPSQTSSPPQSPLVLLSEATIHLQQGDIESAIPLAKKALLLSDEQSIEALPALNLLGEIHVELGEIDAAREYFLKAVKLDEDGDEQEELGGGAEKFLWLAQLSEDGGADSVAWYKKGAGSLRRQIGTLLHSKSLHPVGVQKLKEKERKLAVALCGVVEVYMTDLSWEDDAEQKCEALVTEATMVAPDFAEPWQTLANVRLSQARVEDAQAALRRSLETWKDLAPEDAGVPDFPSRVSLARLLMEAEMEEEAIEVLERLVGEDDSSVEVWYLGGWCMYIMGDKQKNGEIKDADRDGDSWKVSWISSRQWLTQSLHLFEAQDYEDERLGQHAQELISSLNAELGGAVDDDEEEGEEWEDDDPSDGDEDMTGA